MPNKKTILKIISYLFILAIFFFFGKNLVDNWQKVKDFEFSFSYGYLLLSFFFFSLTLVTYSFIWNRLLRKVDSRAIISDTKALRMFMSSWFGRYLPGKVWMFAGRVYLGAKEGIPKSSLLVSVLFEIGLSATAGFLWGLFLVSLAFGFTLGNYYFLLLLLIAAGLIGTHPRIFYPAFNFGLKIIKKPSIPKEEFLNYPTIIKFIFTYFTTMIFDGLGFFFLVNAVAHLPLYDMIGVMGAFNLASVLGMAAIFAPGGLGVREGFLIMFLKFYFPITIAILLSIIARLVVALVEVLVFVISYPLVKIIKKA